jgi:hypothetical protein
MAFRQGRVQRYVHLACLDTIARANIRRLEVARPHGYRLFEARVDSASVYPQWVA